MNRYEILCECYYNENFASKVYLGILNEGYSLSFDEFQNFIEYKILEEEGFFQKLGNFLNADVGVLAGKAKVNHAARNAAAAQLKYGENSDEFRTANANLQTAKQNQVSRLEAENERLQGKKHNIINRANKRINNVTSQQQSNFDMANKLSPQQPPQPQQQQQPPQPQQKGNVNKKALLAAGGTAAAVGGALAIKKALDRKKYKDWVKEDPSKRATATVDDYRVSAAVNESFYQGYIDAINNFY